MKLYTVFEKRGTFDGTFESRVLCENLTMRQIVAKFGDRLDDATLSVRENGDLGDATRLGAWFMSMHRTVHDLVLDSTPRWNVSEEIEQLLAHYFGIDVGSLALDDTIGCFKNDVFDLFEAAFSVQALPRKGRFDFLTPDDLDRLESMESTLPGVDRRDGVDYTTAAFWALSMYTDSLNGRKWDEILRAADRDTGGAGRTRARFLRNVGEKLFLAGWRIERSDRKAVGAMFNVPTYADMWRFEPAGIMGAVMTERLVFVYRNPSRRAADGDPVER